MAGRVEGKVVFITGLAKGQGRAHAVRLAEEGADIIGIDVPGPYDHAAYPMATQDDLDETVNLVEKAGGRIIARQGDVRDRASITKALDDGIAEFGHLDVVVANAGICAMGPRSAEAFLEALDVDLVGVINTIAAAQPHLRAGASVIVTGSVAAMIPGSVDSLAGGPGGAGYGFSKQTIAKLVRELALLWADRSIRVNAVHPTNVSTDLLFNDAMYRTFRPDIDVPTKEDALQTFPTMQALPIAYTEPIDVANAVLYLASDEARYVTGLQMRVDAGSVIKMVPGVL
ncbi:mycofactocin-coupled SDR family oxidoreductase [Mycobacterium avium]|uniref:Carveol dehydrogenase n=1 Tax=Mycobacterium avium (strain 104) TaxID=243243 RepID=A0A0H2ZT91_MYCA1|nr:mycofactocin-coupled SDR family oxidoreductase [Mycobacterium avium]ABK65008.1 carveol dehydrogenase [Mycobacterium avium 104]MCG3242818.1 mycofactocin-coupled SDR family oxidoreductase [Mycobacterium avium subsp. hominissuis]